MTYKDLENCIKDPHESYEVYALRYNHIVDRLNFKLTGDQPKYSHLVCIIRPHKEKRRFGQN